MKQRNIISGRTTKMLLGFAALMLLLAAFGASSRGQGQTSPHGVVTPLASANLVFDGEPACLKVARENGDPDKGPSTFLLEAPSGCVVPPHYHTAEEQWIVVRGDVLTGMEGKSVGSAISACAKFCRSDLFIHSAAALLVGLCVIKLSAAMVGNIAL